MIEPIHITFEVACPPEHAFTIWTAKTSRWWPVTHTVSEAPGLEVVFEPRLGGRIFERKPDGREIDWGEITHWEPPRKLGYLWFIRVDRSDETEVVISFHENGVGSTRVEIEHRGWERLAERGEPWRDANLGGWNGVLPHYVAACGDPALLR